jgi:hypothetical protein
MNPAVEINLERCREIASVVQDMRLPQNLVRQTIFSSDRKVVGNFNLLLVAICHQTQNIHGKVDGKWCRGWDYLERRLNQYCQSNPKFLEIDAWSTMTQASLEQALCQSGEGAAVMDAGPRVQLINDLGDQMTRAGYALFEQLYDAKKRRCSGEMSIISFLKERTQAYADPVEKKARLLIGLLRDVHGWEFSNVRELGAPVDYHEIRGHLRLGTVIINDEALGEKIRSDSVSDSEDHLIRDGVSDAIDAIARYAMGADSLRVPWSSWTPHTRKHSTTAWDRVGVRCLLYAKASRSGPLKRNTDMTEHTISCEARHEVQAASGNACASNYRDGGSIDELHAKVVQRTASRECNYQ